MVMAMPDNTDKRAGKADARAERLAKALRANLARRKGQARARDGLARRDGEPRREGDRQDDAGDAAAPEQTSARATDAQKPQGGGV
jgi:hypothetical protein